MKILQRNHYQEEYKVGKSQLLQKYKNKIDYLIQNSQVSFDSIRTPGWTSLVNTQQSRSTKNDCSKQMYEAYKQPYESINNQKQQVNYQILNRLNSLPKLDASKQVYTKIRVNSLTKNKNLFVYGSQKLQQKKKSQTPKSNRQNKFLSRFSIKSKGYFSQQKNIQNKKKNSPDRRISSVRSDSNKISERFSSKKRKDMYEASDFNSKLQSQSSQKINNVTKMIINVTKNMNNETKKIDKSSPARGFYSKIHANQLTKTQKNEYLNMYLQKLHKRSQSSSSARTIRKQKENLTGEQQKGIPQNKQRFNSITIYDHLFNQGLKLQAKKNMQKMIDQSYLKTNILTFIPKISQKSNLLAESKFQRQNKLQNIPQDTQSSKCLHKTNKSRFYKNIKNSIFTVQQNFTIKQKQKMTQKLHNRTLSKLFMILSNSSPIIDQKNVQINIQRLPMSLLQLIQPILTKVYGKITFSQKQFLQLFSLQQKGMKEVCSKRSVIVGQTQKYLRLKKMNQINQKQNNVKESNRINQNMLKLSQFK